MERNTTNELSAPKYDDTFNQDNKKKKTKYVALTSRDYVLHETIGEGYCGIIKLATSKMHDCNVAIKIVSKFRAPSEYLKIYFFREIEIVRGLQHPNIIKYLHLIETTHRIYIIMEYAMNGNLFDYIKLHIYVNEPQSRHWFNQLINAVEYCHAREIAHRNIKCENLLLDKNYNLKLSDFGFARRVFKVNNHAGLVNTFCGSYAYTAPEVLKGRSYNPFISDIWSMGVVLYAMVHGCLPFDDTNYFILLKQVRSKVLFPEKPKVSDECRALIIRILKPRKERPELIDIKNDVWFIDVEPEINKSEDVAQDNLEVPQSLSQVSKELIDEETLEVLMDQIEEPICSKDLPDVK